jgi:hypothetical protein
VYLSNNTFLNSGFTLIGTGDTVVLKKKKKGKKQKEGRGGRGREREGWRRERERETKLSSQACLQGTLRLVRKDRVLRRYTYN